MVHFSVSVPKCDVLYNKTFIWHLFRTNTQKRFLYDYYEREIGKHFRKSDVEFAVVVLRIRSGLENF